MSYICFFFQAEDGIRDLTVTSSDVCSSDLKQRADTIQPRGAARPGADSGPGGAESGDQVEEARETGDADQGGRRDEQIGRASCRERVQISVVDVSVKKKKTDAAVAAS